MEMGESELYIGNQNKSNKDIPIDYKMKHMLMKASDLVTEEVATDLSIRLVRWGLVLTK